MGVFQVGIFQVGVILGENLLGGSYPGWKLSLVGVFWVGIVQGDHPGENFRSGSFPSTDGVGGLLVFRKTFLIESVMIVSL